MDVPKRLSCIRLMNLAEKHKSFAEEIGLQVKLVSPAYQKKTSKPGHTKLVSG